MKISFAQNGEDVVLDRAFAQQDLGTWVDVGAAHPVRDSVTKLFSLRGWSGVNLEPLPHLHKQLVADRPRDINLELAVSDHRGHLKGFECTGEDCSGLTTFDPEVAAHHRGKGLDFRSIAVDVVTLDEVFRTWTKDRVDFLKIDVEGHEAAVLTGANLRQHAPRVVVVESTYPTTHRQTHDEWEHHLLAADYTFGTFDGLNRYYVHRDEPDLLEPLSYPAGSYDHFLPLLQAERIHSLQGQLANRQELLSRLEDELERLRGTTRGLPVALAHPTWLTPMTLETEAERRLLYAPGRSSAAWADLVESAIRPEWTGGTIVLWLPDATSDELAHYEGLLTGDPRCAELDVLVVTDPDEVPTAARLVGAVTDVLAPQGALATVTRLLRSDSPTSANA